jgi:hypothetical protein
MKRRKGPFKPKCQTEVCAELNTSLEKRGAKRSKESSRESPTPGFVIDGASALQGTRTFYSVVSARGVNYESISTRVRVGPVPTCAPFPSVTVGRRLPSQPVMIAALGSSAYL